MNETLNNMSSKTSFLLGIVIAVAVISTIGFVVTASMLARQNNDVVSGANEKVGANNAPAPSANPTAPSGSGNIQLAAVTERDHILGDKNAPISIVEFSDLECPFCARFHPTMKQIISEYDGQVNWVYRHFPLNSIHKNAQPAAEASECAAEVGGNDKFWEFIDYIFENKSYGDLQGTARAIGLDMNKFNTCVESGKYKSKVESETAQAQAAGGRGTPYSVIVAGDQKVPLSGALPVEQVRAALDSLVK